MLVLAACGGSSDDTNPAGAGGEVGQAPTVVRSALPRDPASSLPEATVAAIVDADNAFAFDVYGKVCATTAADNAVMSPLSVSLALGMTWAGAQSTTASEMAKVLHFDAPGLDAHGGHNALLQALDSRADEAFAAAQQKAKQPGSPAPSPDDFRLQIVNAVWGQTDYTWEQPFLDTLARSYGTGVYLADFRAQADTERARINDWVSAETKNKISDLLPEESLGSLTAMVLVNAMHLKLPWESPFDKNATKAGDFTKSDGTMVQADFMSQAQELACFEDDTAQVASIPLVGRKLSLVVARPKGTLGPYEEGLTSTTWKSAWEGRQTKRVALQLPKFSFTSGSVNLKEVLKSLGMLEGFCTTNPTLLRRPQRNPMRRFA